MWVLVGLAMIVEHELLEQLMDEEAGRALEWVSRFIEEHGRAPFVLLGGMVHAGYLRFEDARGEPLPAWQIERLWREGTSTDPIRVRATQLGLDRLP